MSKEDFYNQKAQELFQIPYVYPYQRLVIFHILNNQGYWGMEQQQESSRTNLYVLPTGAGKSLCFMLPGMLIQGTTLVVYPLKSLIQDQLRRLRQMKIEAGVLQGGMTTLEKTALKESLFTGKVKFLLTNPEMCNSSIMKEALSAGVFSQLIVDEAHTVMQWGSSFRPAMLNLRELTNETCFKGIHFFTATILKEEREALRKELIGPSEWNVIEAPGDRPNLSYHLLSVPSRLMALREILKANECAVLVFCASRRDTERCYAFLSRNFPERWVDLYHAGLFKEAKARREGEFLESSNAILCATCAYGMGVDHSGIDLVIHWNPPQRIESYLQEAGRAGRGGQEAHSIILQPLAEKPNPFISALASKDQCRRYTLLELMGQKGENCGGCDYCTPRGWTEATEAVYQALLGYFKKYSRRWSKGLWMDLLLGWHGPGVRSAALQRHGLMGILEFLPMEELEELFHTALATGVIHIPRRGLWRNVVCWRGRVMKF